MLGVPHLSVCGKNKYLPLSILQKLNIYWPTKSLLTVLFGYSFAVLVVLFVWISFIKSLYLMFILLLLFYLVNINKTPLQIHFSPHCTLLWHCVLRLSYCIKWSQIIFLPQSNFYYCFTINTITHGKTSFAASAGSRAAKLSPSSTDFKQPMLVTKIWTIDD